MEIKKIQEIQKNCNTIDKNIGLSEQEIINEDELILNYIKKFLKEDKFRAINFCYKWNGVNGITFTEKHPEDFIMELISFIYENKRKFYLKSYKNFKNSFYYHLKFMMLTYFKCSKKNKKEEDNPNLDKLVYFQADDNEMDIIDGSESFLSKLESNEIQEKIVSIFNEENEADERLYCECFICGYKRDEIAEMMGLTPYEVSVIKKRVDRKLNKNQNKLRSLYG